MRIRWDCETLKAGGSIGGANAFSITVCRFQLRTKRKKLWDSQNLQKNNPLTLWKTKEKPARKAIESVTQGRSSGLHSLLRRWDGASNKIHEHWRSQFFVCLWQRCIQICSLAWFVGNLTLPFLPKLPVRLCRAVNLFVSELKTFSCIESGRHELRDRVGHCRLTSVRTIDLYLFVNFRTKIF